MGMPGGGRPISLVLQMPVGDQALAASLVFSRTFHVMFDIVELGSSFHCRMKLI
jgi:hypothetical protein